MSKVNLNVLMGVWVLMAALTDQTEAATHYVSPGQSIQAAIDNTNNYDHIEVAPGTYYESINFNGKAIHLYSSDGPDVTTIDANGAYHAVQCVSGENANTILEGFTITGGDANGPTDTDKSGGGMYSESSSPTVTNCTFSDNTAQYYGGGMFNYNNSSPTVNNCIFNQNHADFGGGMCNLSSSLNVTDCIFTNNSATCGGAMCNFYSSPNVINCVFKGNSDSGYGSGMYNDQSSPNVINCTFEQNSVGRGGRGGGMYNYSSSPTVTNSIFTQNSAPQGRGGGMYNEAKSDCTVTNCTFKGNWASSGGGIYNRILSCPTVTNCILWNNTPQEIYNYDETSIPTVTFSDVKGGYTGSGNINADPLFVEIPSGNVRLQAFSPCIDAGDNGALPADITDLDNDDNTTEPIPFDLDGRDRIIDGDLEGGAVVDMGAFERLQPECITVDDDGPADFSAIQAAIEDANHGDRIEVAPGTYYESINFNGKAIRLYSSAGPDVTTIDGTGYYHVVKCVSGENFNTVFEGFTITGGNANGSGNNGYGGGMFNYQSSPTVTNCIFTGNSASMWGGGMFNDDYSSPTLTYCKFTGNLSSSGGGMYNYSSSPVVTNCTFTGNSAYYAGGMYNFDNSPTLINCTFSGNSASYAAGGMFNYYQSSPTVANCTFIGNSASSGGGMLSSSYSSPVVINCTFTGNSAVSFGGGVWNDDYSNPTVANCILWCNTPDEIYNTSSTPTVTFSDVEGGYTGTGNINADPCFVDVSNPDPDLWNLHLKYASACIDEGDNNVSGLAATDIDGHPRIIDGDCDDGDVVDMGAYEFNYVYMGDLDYNCRVDFFDLSIFGRAWETKAGDSNWDWACDISAPPDDYINWRDVAILCDNWLASIGQ